MYRVCHFSPPDPVQRPQSAIAAGFQFQLGSSKEIDASIPRRPEAAEEGTGARLDPLAYPSPGAPIACHPAGSSECSATAS
jgi:hypothetical protein